MPRVSRREEAHDELSAAKSENNIIDSVNPSTNPSKTAQSNQMNRIFVTHGKNGKILD
jgi:hypothetical protein